MQKQLHTMVVDFSVGDTLAYLSHQETLKMFQRSFIRAGLPLAFSCGFNPHPQISIPLPRSVAVQSQSERVCAAIDMDSVFDSENWMDRIQRQLPEGCHVLRIQCLEGKCSFQPYQVHYRLSLKQAVISQLHDHLNSCQNQLIKNTPIQIQRYWAKKRKYKQIDISTFIKKLNVTNENIDVFCNVFASGTVRVDEIMHWLNIETKDLSQPVTRMEICWS